ncbi:MAG: sensor histidine kinase [Candidatus Limnocylindrales bacterium]
MPAVRLTPFWRASAVVFTGLLVGTGLVGLLEDLGGLGDASPVYLLVVVVVAVFGGARAAIVTAVGAFLAYDYLFVDPRHTLVVDDPQEWLTLLLLLVVGLVVGRLAGLERDRAETAIVREREARALFDISFALSGRTDLDEALDAIAAVLYRATGMTRVWVEIGERVAADIGGRAPPLRPSVHVVLGRRPGDRPAEWTRVHVPKTGSDAVRDPDKVVYRVQIDVGERNFGSVWAERQRMSGRPTADETRILAAAADQIGGALERERLQRDATTAEIARRSDALKSALLDSVSHDLRTPLASIRAAAGTLMDPQVDWSEADRRDIARSIDREAERLNQLVSNLLDMSRIDAGEIRPRTAAFVLDDLVRYALENLHGRLAGMKVEVDVPTDLAPVEVDDVFIGQVLGNLLENEAKYAGEGATVRITARPLERAVELVIEDDGPGVPDASMARLFEKFYRVPRGGEGARRGSGMGLAVVRGLMEAMGGTADVERSPLGGLRVRLTIPTTSQSLAISEDVETLR